jgi:hypothetical protein
VIPLYLDAVGEPLGVTLDGPCLRIRRAARADQPVPLARLGRVVARGPVTWSGEALAACLRAGVPVLVLDGIGRPLGACLPETPRASDLAELVDGCCALGHWPAVRDAWRRAGERRAILLLLGRTPARLDELRPGPLRRQLLRSLDAALPAAAEATALAAGAEGLIARLEALLLAEIGHLLLGEGAGARFQGADPDLDLRRDLLQIAGFELWPLAFRLADYLTRHAGKHRTERALQMRLVRWFEPEAPAVRSRVARELGRLRRALREAVT